jgi:hypothetical protein
MGVSCILSPSILFDATICAKPIFANESVTKIDSNQYKRKNTADASLNKFVREPLLYRCAIAILSHTSPSIHRTTLLGCFPCDTQPHTTHSATTAIQQSKEINTQPLPIQLYDPSKQPLTNNQAFNLPINPPPPIQTNQTNTQTQKTTNTCYTTTANTQISTIVDIYLNRKTQK